MTDNNEATVWNIKTGEDDLGFWQFESADQYLRCDKQWPGDILSFWDMNDEEFKFWSQFLTAEQLYAMRVSQVVGVSPTQLKRSSKILRNLSIPDLDKQAEISIPGNLFKLYSIDGVSVPDANILEESLRDLIEKHYQESGYRRLLDAYKFSLKTGNGSEAIKSILQIGFLHVLKIRNAYRRFRQRRANG